MGRQIVNPTTFRLGLGTFWKTELFSQNKSQIFKNNLNIYRLIKASFNYIGFEPITFKVFESGLKLKILINAYRYKIYDKKRRRRLKVQQWAKYRKPKSVRKKKLLSLKKDSMKLKANLIKLTRRKLIDLKIKNIFSKNENNVFKISKHIYQISKKNFRVRKFKYLKDLVSILNFTFVFLKSELLSKFMAKLLKFHKNVFFIALNTRSCIKGFKFYHLKFLSVRISIFGKTRGASRTKIFTFSFGNLWPIQTISSKLSFDLAQTWNVFGSFGIKVWIFNNLMSIKKIEIKI